MFGKDIGFLAVYKASSLNRTVDEMLWKRVGEIDKYWHQALVTIYDEEEFMVRRISFIYFLILSFVNGKQRSFFPLQILLEAGVGLGPLGDIAVDDIRVLRGRCLDEYIEGTYCGFYKLITCLKLKDFNESI